MAQPVDIISDRVIAKLNLEKPTSSDSKSTSTYVDVDKIISDSLASMTKDVNIIMEGGTPAFADRPVVDNNPVSALVNAHNETEYNKRVNSASYFADAKERQPASPEQRESFNTEYKQATRPTRTKAKAYSNPKTDKQSNAENIGKPYSFSSIDANGNKVNFTAKPTYGHFKLMPDDLERDNAPKNVNTIKKYITKMVYESVGGWDRVTSIKAKTGYLMVNNMMIIPQSQHQFSKNGLPLDVYDYLSEGAIAYLFNWNMLEKMNNLLTLDVDTVDFYMSEICTDLGIGRTGGYKSIFYYTTLQVLKIGDNVLTREQALHPQKEDANVSDIAEQLSQEKRGLAILDGYKVNVYSNTNAFESWNWGNLRDYAKNRGNKGIFRYGVGCTMRFLLSASSSVVNAGAHLIGGTFKVLKQAFKDGMTPVNQQ